MVSDSEDIGENSRKTYSGFYEVLKSNNEIASWKSKVKKWHFWKELGVGYI